MHNKLRSSVHRGCWNSLRRQVDQQGIIQFVKRSKWYCLGTTGPLAPCGFLSTGGFFQWNRSGKTYTCASCRRSRHVIVLGLFHGATCSHLRGGRNIISICLCFLCVSACLGRRSRSIHALATDFSYGSSRKARPCRAASPPPSGRR